MPPIYHLLVPSAEVSNGILYIGSENGEVYALRSSTGTIVWSYQTQTYIADNPTVANGIVYIDAGEASPYGATLFALDARTGDKIWSYPVAEYYFNAPTVANGVVYIGSFDHKVYALNASSGSRIWFYSTGGEVSSILIEKGVTGSVTTPESIDEGQQLYILHFAVCIDGKSE